MAGEISAIYLQNPELANALRRQQFGASLMQQGMDGAPVNHWAQGLSRLAQALVGGYEQGQADKDIKAAGEKRSKLAEALFAPYGGGMPAPDMATLIQSEAEKRGLPPSLATALYATESNFNPTARNPKSGAFGIGQVLPSTAANPGYGLQPITETDLADPRKAIPWTLDYFKARGGALGVTDWNDPQQVARALRAYGENTDEYVNKVQSRMGGAQVVGPGAPTGQPQRTPGTQDLGEAQYYEQQAMRAQAAGMHQEAQMLMMRAQRAQQAALARQPQPTEIERVAIAAGYPPGSPEYQKLMRDYAAKKGAGVNVTVNPNPPADHRAVYDDQGRLTHYEVIPGSETARKVAEQQKKEGKREDQTARASNIIVEDIDRVLKGVDSAVLPAVGVGASTLSGIPGTAAHDVSKLLDGVKANIAFDKLQQMRESSPTGAALGAVSDREMALLQSVVGSLEQSQSSAQFKQNLQRLRNLTMDVIHGAGKWKEAAPSDTTPTAGPGGNRPPLSSFAR